MGRPTDRDPLPGAHPGIDDVRFQAWRRYVVSHGMVVRLLADDLEREARVPITWYQVLLLLNEADDHRMVMQHLNERVTLSQSGVSRLIARMEADGLVRRVRSSTDRRSVFAEITAMGIEELEKATPVHLDGIARWFTNELTDEEAATVADLFGRVQEAAESEVRRRVRRAEQSSNVGAAPG